MIGVSVLVSSLHHSPKTKMIAPLFRVTLNSSNGAYFEVAAVTRPAIRSGGGYELACGLAITGVVHLSTGKIVTRGDASNFMILNLLLISPRFERV
jgi:hypothetical protein